MALKAGFLMGGDTNETPQTLARKRALIAQIMANGKAPTNIGEGLNALGDGIVANVMGRRADKAEAAGQASANEAFSPIASMFTGGGFGGMGGIPAPIEQAPSPLSGGMPSAQTDISGSKAEFVNSLLPAAMEESKRTGVDPRIIVAQAAQETGWGRSAPGNNYFGIKSHGQAGGNTLSTTEYVDGQPQTEMASFRGYSSPQDSVRGYGDFILQNPRYKPLREAQGLDGQLAALQASGYATDPNYSRSVGSIARGIQIPGDMGNSANAAEAVTAMGQGGQMPSQASAYVDPMISAPNSQPQPAMAPQQGPSPNGLPFDLTKNSPQLARADTRQGILRALTGQIGAAPGVTGAFPAAPGSSPMAAPQASPAPSMAAPSPAQTAPAPAAQQGMGQVSTQQLIAAINNPWLNDSQRAIAQSMLDQQMQANDPMRQLQIQKLRKEVEGTGRGEIKIAGDRALLLKPDGTVEDVTPALNGGDKPAGFRYSGKSVEAQALNGLIDSGQLTPEQAQQLGAGKTITGPNGEIIFMTPQGVFGQSAGGGQPQPISSPQQAAPSAPVQQQGMIPLTEPKVTVDEKKAMTFADRMTTSGAIIDSMGMTGSGMKDKLASGVPLLGEYLTSDEYKKVDQAKRDFVNAQLRRESGAVISPKEFDNAEKQYFPQPNDPPEVVEQKRRNREIVISGMARDSGPTYKAPSSQPTATMGGEKKISEMTDAELEALAHDN